MPSRATVDYWTESKRVPALKTVEKRLKDPTRSEKLDRSLQAFAALVELPSALGDAFQRPRPARPQVCHCILHSPVAWYAGCTSLPFKVSFGPFTNGGTGDERWDHQWCAILRKKRAAPNSGCSDVATQV